MQVHLGTLWPNFCVFICASVLLGRNANFKSVYVKLATCFWFLYAFYSFRQPIPPTMRTKFGYILSWTLQLLWQLSTSNQHIQVNMVEITRFTSRHHSPLASTINGQKTPSWRRFCTLTNVFELVRSHKSTSVGEMKNSDNCTRESVDKRARGTPNDMPISWLDSQIT